MAEIKKYKKKLMEVEAVQIPNLDDEDNVTDIIEWGEGHIVYDADTYTDPVLGIETKSGHHYACPGDWIIKGIDGTFYATTDETFQQLYVAAEANSDTGYITW